MADHIFAAETLARLVSDGAPSGGGRLAVEIGSFTEVFDPDDATRVEETGGRVRAIAKGLARFNAVDTGLLLLTPLAFEAVATRACAAATTRSLGDAQALARHSSLNAWDIGPRRWVDVDTPAAAAAAERLVGLGLVGTPRDAGATERRARVTLRAALLLDAARPAAEWDRLLRLRVAGLPLLVRQLQCSARGLRHHLLIGSAWQ